MNHFFGLILIYFTIIYIKSFQIDGEFKFTITTQQLKKLQKDLSNVEFIVEANVTEGVTGLMMKDSDEIQFYDSPAKIEFVSSLPNNYKPGLKYTALVSRFFMEFIYCLSTGFNIIIFLCFSFFYLVLF